MGTDNDIRLLLVDDSASCLSTLRRAFYHDGFTVKTTTDACQALRIFEYEGPFAVVISDFCMPEMTGIALFAKIFALDQRVQKILLTGHAEFQIAQEAINYGKVNAFLTKPVAAAMLRTVVLEAIRLYRGLAAQAGSPPPVQARQVSPEAAASGLTIKEKEVLYWLSQGLSNEEIADKLHITPGTAKCHLNNLFSKLQVNSRTKAIVRSRELGLLGEE